METQADTKAKIADLKQRYAKLARNCKAAGIRVNPGTINAYLKELQTLEVNLA